LGADKPLLSAVYSNALQELIDSNNPPPIQAIEFGFYNKPDVINRFLPRLQKYRLHFHPGSMIRFLGGKSPLIDQFNQYLKLITPPWLSFHIILKSYWRIFLAKRQIYKHPLPVNGHRNKSFINKINTVHKIYKLPFLLELMPASNHNDRIESDPRVITSIIEETESEFLLDIAHARINAIYLGFSFEHYLKQLPLFRTRQIHISGIRTHNGYYFDAHETINPDDIDCLKKALNHTNPEVITLEYHKDSALLAKQLDQLAEIINFN
jgi:uncharacterized protein (UPF0276 family)